MRQLGHPSIGRALLAAHAPLDHGAAPAQRLHHGSLATSRTRRPPTKAPEQATPRQSHEHKSRIDLIYEPMTVFERGPGLDFLEHDCTPIQQDCSFGLI